MTIVLREVFQVDQTLVYYPPVFQARAILAFGHSAFNYGKTTAAGLPSEAAWGFLTEAGAAQWGGVTFGITGVGSLETGSSSFWPGSVFIGNGGNPVAPGQLQLDSFGCGELELTAILDDATRAGLLIMGGNTLETAVGYDTFSGTGNKAITGLGFQPDLLLFGGSGLAFTGGGGPNPGPVNGSFGAADANGNQFAVAGGDFWNVNTNQRRCQTVNDACFLQVKPAAMKADLVSMDSDGFTLNCSIWSGSEIFWWVAIKDPGGQFAVGTMTEGDASIAPGFAPEAVFFACAGNTGYGSDELGVGLAYGGASDDGTELSGWASAPGGNINSAHYWQTKALSWILHPTAGGVVSEAEADVSAWASPVGLTWTTGPGANGIVAGWVALKTSEGKGYGGCGGGGQVMRWW